VKSSTTIDVRVCSGLDDLLGAPAEANAADLLDALASKERNHSVEDVLFYRVSSE